MKSLIKKDIIIYFLFYLIYFLFNILRNKVIQIVCFIIKKKNNLCYNKLKERFQIYEKIYRCELQLVTMILIFSFFCFYVYPFAIKKGIEHSKLKKHRQEYSLN